MTELNTEIQTLILNEDTKIKIEAISLSSGSDKKASINDLEFDKVIDVIEVITDKLLAPIKKAKPKKATVEFGLAIGVEAGEITALWVKGHGTAHIKITMEWEGS